MVEPELVPRVMFGVVLWSGRDDRLIKKIQEGMALSGKLYTLGEAFIDYHPNNDIHIFGCVFKRVLDSEKGKPVKLDLSSISLHPNVRTQWTDAVKNIFAEIGVPECAPMMVVALDI